MKKEHGIRISLYDKVWRELCSLSIGAEHQRNVEGDYKERYNYLTEIGTDGEAIVIKAGNPERLNFAKKVAEYYGARYEIVEQLWRRDPEERYKIKIYTEE